MAASGPRFPYAMTLVYLLGGAGLLLFCALMKNLPGLLVALGILALGAVQGFIDRRDQRRGQSGVHQDLLLGPLYAILAAFWLYRGLVCAGSLNALLGLAWLVLAAVQTARIVRGLRSRA